MKRLPHYSQHFLRNPRLVKELVGHTSINRNDTVYDIGAGSGVITSVLAERCRNVIAVEFEPHTAAILRRNIGKYPNVAVIEGDFLSMDLPREPYKIFANIPFHLSSPIIHKITETAVPPRAAYLIVQKQFAYKLLPDYTGFSSQLGMSIGPEFEVRIKKRLRRTDFWPHPNVDTVLLELKPRDVALIESSQITAYRQFITKNFSSPQAFSKCNLTAISMPSGVKPSALTLDQWVVLFTASNRRR